MRFALLCVLFLASLARAQEPIHVYLLAGQSNMVGGGNASSLPASLRTPQSDVWYCHWTNELAPTVWGPLCTRGNRFGPEMTFGRGVKDAHPDWEVAIVKVSYNGTNLYRQWNPTYTRAQDRPMWWRFTTFTDQRLEDLRLMGYDPIVEAVVWDQGEADSVSVNQIPHDLRAAQYQTNLQVFIGATRDRYGQGVRLHAVRVHPLSASYPFNDQVRDAIDAVAAEIPGCTSTAVEDLPLKADLTHYTAQGYITLGYRLAALE